MTHLTNTQIDELKDTLLEEKRGLEAHFEAEKDEVDDSLLDTSGELSTVDNHPADLATETFERGRDQAIDESLDEQLEQVNRSLEQIAAGAYGKCEVCGEDIPFERLQVIPYVTTCIEHAKQEQQDEAAVGLEARPVEEQVQTHSPGHFDDVDAWQTVENFGTSDSPAMADDRDPDSIDELSSDRSDQK